MEALGTTRWPVPSLALAGLPGHLLSRVPQDLSAYTPPRLQQRLLKHPRLTLQHRLPCQGPSVCRALPPPPACTHFSFTYLARAALQSKARDLPSLTTPQLQLSCQGPVAHRTPGHHGLPPLQFWLAWQGARCMRATASLSRTQSASAVLPGRLLCRSPRTPWITPHLNFSYPAKVPAVHWASAYPGLHLL